MIAAEGIAIICEIALAFR